MPDESLSVAEVEKIQRQFRAIWNPESPPSISSFLAGASLLTANATNSRLLLEALIAADVELRLADGQSISSDAYVDLGAQRPLPTPTACLPPTSRCRQARKSQQATRVSATTHFSMKLSSTRRTILKSHSNRAANRRHPSPIRREPIARVEASGPTSCCRRSAKAVWAKSGWQSKESRFDGALRSRSFDPIAQPTCSSPVSKPNGRHWR